jgi:pimeloyl-ACP methyl ester carboxylesterase
VKILFRKVVARRLGFGYDWPRLSLIDYDASGRPHAEHDPEAVRAGLDRARTALLLVPGIIGDATGLALGVGPAGSGLHRRWDAVLTLDYESLDTSIERSGSDLVSALARVGVQPGGDGPRLTVVAHSMGGLVARGFIECQSGAAVTDRLVTCGTPHQGSPWPRVQDVVTATLGLLLNVPLAVGGPGAVVGSALAFLARAGERFDTALDEMRPGSDLLTSLASTADPGVPYVTLRGTRPWALDPDGGVGEWASRIIHKLTGTSLDLVFAGEPNDLAVSVSSAAGVGSSWPNAGLRVVDVACNHVSFFTSPAGQQALASALET